MPCRGALLRLPQLALQKPPRVAHLVLEPQLLQRPALHVPRCAHHSASWRCVPLHRERSLRREGEPHEQSRGGGACRLRVRAPCGSLVEAPQRRRRHVLDGAEDAHRGHLRRAARGESAVRGLLHGRGRGAVLRQEPRERAGRRKGRDPVLGRLREGSGRKVPHELRTSSPSRARRSR